MATYYGDFQGFVTTGLSAYPISYSGAGLFDLSPIAEEMMDMLPSYFYLGNNNRRIMELLAVVLLDYANDIEDLRNQFFVETATWGLRYWEQLVGVPILDGNQDWEARRAVILAKLRDCSSERCFVEGLESIIGGRAIVLDLDPVTNPYQISIELKASDVTYNGPSTAPTAAAYSTGPLTGDYTYRVTYEYDPVSIPKYLSLFPYTNSSGVFGSTEVYGQRQFLQVSGAGTFWLTMAGLGASAGPFTATSTAQEIVDALIPTLEAKYGPDAVSTPFAGNDVGAEGVLLVFDGVYSKGVNLPVLQVTNVTGTIAGTPVIVSAPEFVQPEVTGETPSGGSPIRVSEIQEIGQGPGPVLPITGGTFVIRRNTIWDENFPPVYEETIPLGFASTAEQIQGALEALPSVYPSSVQVTGGPLPSQAVEVKFVGVEAGFPQSLLVVDNSDLVGGGFLEVTRATLGTTTYSGSESNTITASGNSIILSNVPRSSEGATRRNIYRKRTQAPYNEWRYVGSIEDNYTAIFVDSVPDETLSEVQELVVYGAGTFKLRFDSEDTVTLSTASGPAAVEAAIEAVTTLSYPTLGVTVTGTSPQFSDGGLVIKFDGGDVVGKDVPQMEVVDPVGITGRIRTTGPRYLTESNTAFTNTFQRLLQYIYVTKPAHIRVRELRSSAFRASINVAGDTI